MRKNTSFYSFSEGRIAKYKLAGDSSPDEAVPQNEPIEESGVREQKSEANKARIANNQEEHSDKIHKLIPPEPLESRGESQAEDFGGQPRQPVIVAPESGEASEYVAQMKNLLRSVQVLLDELKGRGTNQAVQVAWYIVPFGSLGHTVTSHVSANRESKVLQEVKSKLEEFEGLVRESGLKIQGYSKEDINESARRIRRGSRGTAKSVLGKWATTLFMPPIRVAHRLVTAGRINALSRQIAEIQGELDATVSSSKEMEHQFYDAA